MNDTIMFEVLGWAASVYLGVVLVQLGYVACLWFKTRESIGDRWIREDKNATDK